MKLKRCAQIFAWIFNLINLTMDDSTLFALFDSFDIQWRSSLVLETAEIVIYIISNFTNILEGKGFFS